MNEEIILATRYGKAKALIMLRKLIALKRERFERFFHVAINRWKIHMYLIGWLGNQGSIGGIPLAIISLTTEA
jgi:hypothetical protein